LPINDDVIVNISTYNHYLGFKQIKKFFNNTNFHIIHEFDNHLDGSLTVLRDGIFLVSNEHIKLFNDLPDKFKKWKILIANCSDIKDIDMSGFTDKEVRLASSAGMDLNVLSLDENTVLVNKRAISIIRLLEKNKFNVIPV
jgi:glycine amidinotransferase